MPNLLIVDDEPNAQAAMQHPLKGVYPYQIVSNGKEAVDYVQQHEVDLVLLDITMPVMGGFEALERIKRYDATIEVVMVSADTNEDTGIHARELGAFSYVTKASLRADPVQYLNVIERALEKRETVLEAQARGVANNEALSPIIGESPAMQAVKTLITQSAQTDMAVLLEGPTGVGKELVARAIHAAGPRAGRPFIAINCSAIPPTLFAAEMFGAEKGAFTGADARRKGKFELAHRGTLFLDEIGAMPMEQQVMLLRAVEEKTIQRLGGEREIKIDVRVVAATDTNLKEAIAAKLFHAPLFYRLSGIPIHLPPLHARPDDITTLLDYFVNLFNKKCRRTKQLSPEARTLCLRYPWPGNVREMKSLIERAVSVYAGETILPQHLPPEFGGAVPQAARGSTNAPSDDKDDKIEIPLTGQPLTAVQDAFERQLIGYALKQANGVYGQAAKLLEMDPKTLRTKIRKLGIQ